MALGCRLSDIYGVCLATAASLNILFDASVHEVHSLHCYGAGYGEHHGFDEDEGEVEVEEAKSTRHE